MPAFVNDNLIWIVAAVVIGVAALLWVMRSGKSAALPDAERQAALMKVAEVIKGNSEYLAEWVTREQGKPLGGVGPDQVPGSRFELWGCEVWTQVPASLPMPVEVAGWGGGGQYSWKAVEGRPLPQAYRQYLVCSDKAPSFKDSPRPRCAPRA